MGDDLAVIGKSLLGGGRSLTVVGVSPPEFFGTQPGRSMDITAPITLESPRLPGTALICGQRITYTLRGIMGSDTECQNDRGRPVSVLRTVVPRADNDLGGSEAISLI